MRNQPKTASEYIELSIIGGTIGGIVFAFYPMLLCWRLRIAPPKLFLIASYPNLLHHLLLNYQSRLMNLIIDHGKLIILVIIALLIFVGKKYEWKGVVTVFITLAILNGFAFSGVAFMVLIIIGVIFGVLSALLGIKYIRK
ncbi:MAG: hypothetical protein LBB81_07740 [Treponema sp.]|jgi:hypothetical protein|nr:hypothetical protein [Treponema sp.]